MFNFEAIAENSHMTIRATKENKKKMSRKCLVTSYKKMLRVFPIHDVIFLLTILKQCDY
jgi:hypothetical protein